MSKVYATGDLYVGMRFSLPNSTLIWEIDVIDFDINFVGLTSELASTSPFHRSFDRYDRLIAALNEQVYIEIPEETFQIET